MSLEMLAADMQQRFGYQTLMPAAELRQCYHTISTGLTAVDELLDGGLLRGAAHCLSGQPSSGATSLLYHALASAQTQGIAVVYLDMSRLFDPPNAAAAGVEIERLSLIRGASSKHALFLLRALARQQQPCLVVIDQPNTLPLTQLKSLLRDAPLTLLVLAHQPLRGMQVALSCRRADWRVKRGDIIGFNSQVRLTAHPFLPRRQVRLTFAIAREEACSAPW